MEWAKEYKRCILDTIQAEAEHSCEKDLGNRVNAVKWKEALKGRLRSDRLSQAGFGGCEQKAPAAGQARGFRGWIGNESENAKLSLISLLLAQKTRELL